MTSILKVAIDAPVMQAFDYLAPEKSAVAPGQRVLVPFRKARRVGVVLATSDHSDVPAGKLRRILKLLDPQPFAQVISADRKVKPAATTFPAASGREQLGLFDSLQFLEREGFSCIFSRFADSPGMAAHLAHRLGFPVALKIDSPDILHKSDVGGVRLHLQSGQDVQLAYDQMMAQVKEHCPTARLNGAVVSPMAFAGLEVILGMSRDLQFGPGILFGLGGVTVELFRDVALRPLPLDRQQAREMIDETKGAPLLKGFRGQPVLDETAVVDALREHFPGRVWQRRSVYHPAG